MLRVYSLVYKLLKDKLMSRILKLSRSLVIACAVNFLLFIIVPVIHALLGFGINDKKPLEIKNKIITEFVQKKEEKPKQQRKQIRSVSNSRGRSSSNNMQLKFSPDLSVAQGEGVAVEAKNLEAVVFEAGETDEDPIVISTPPITYPARAREMGVQGVLIIEIVIGTNGRVEKVDVLKSPHQIISQEAQKTVMRWRFKPAKNKGVPVKVRVRNEINFQLK